MIVASGAIGVCCHSARVCGASFCSTATKSSSHEQMLVDIGSGGVASCGRFGVCGERETRAPTREKTIRRRAALIRRRNFARSAITSRSDGCCKATALFGAALAGRPTAARCRQPPQTNGQSHARCSWHCGGIAIGCRQRRCLLLRGGRSRRRQQVFELGRRRVASTANNYRPPPPK